MDLLGGPDYIPSIKHFVEMLLIEKSYETGDAQPMQIADYVSHAKGV